MRVILLGPPGAGKGTQAKALAGRLNFPHISTGDILRQDVSKGEDLGKEARCFMDKGELVPDTLVTQMLSRKLSEPDVKKGFILDGYPRNINQARSLDEILADKNSPIDLVIYLDTSKDVIIQRLSGRRVCKSCGANFHIKNMPPKVDGICDSCGGSLYQRSDDKEETIRTRLKVYEREVSSLMRYYESGHKLHNIVADEEAAVVLNKCLSLLTEYDDSLKV